jgi:hypothetical protein
MVVFNRNDVDKYRSVGVLHIVALVRDHPQYAFARDLLDRLRRLRSTPRG